jgi:hypothetical protein
MLSRSYFALQGLESLAVIADRQGGILVEIIGFAGIASTVIGLLSARLFLAMRKIDTHLNSLLTTSTQNLLETFVWETRKLLTDKVAEILNRKHAVNGYEKK